MDLKAQLKAEALALGFVDCRIARAEAAPHFPQYLGWLEAGCHAEIAYLSKPQAINRRQDARELLPGCRSVICLALAYAPNPAAASGAEQPTGRIAAYATYPDYHEVMHQKLQALEGWLRSQTGSSISLRCVDTSAILEKDYAQAAGLGWIAGNSLLTHPIYGSWILLGEILTDLKLEADPPVNESSCQDCLRCQMACPTKALLPERSVDARRCLSYLSIEHRGPIPEAMRPLMGTRLFGCDTCQVICPQHLQQAPAEAGFKPILDSQQDLLEVLEMDELAFKSRYGKTPVIRAKRQGLRRNAAICLGNSQQDWVLPILRRHLEDEQDDVVADALQWAIARLEKA